MRRRLVIPALAALSALALVAAGGADAKKPRIDKQRLWATVNACDTAAHPDEIGIRASMPGDGRRARMYMRFRVQYLDADSAQWRNLPATDTGYRYVGSSRYKARQSGLYQKFDPPKAGTTFTLRGKVFFRWVRKGKSYRHASRLTTAGHKSSAGADPPGYSADICELR